MPSNPRILFIQYTDPGAYPPLLHAARLLAEKGWDVKFLGVSHPGFAVMPVPAHPRLAVRLMPRPENGWLHKIHFLWFHVRAIGTALHWGAESVYASECLGAPSGLFLAWLGLDVVFHEHDPPAPTRSFFMKLLFRARTALARRALLVVIPNQARLAAFVRETRTHRPVHLVWNCPLRAEIPVRARTHQHGPLRLYYHGSIVPDRLPLTVLRAMARCRFPTFLTLAGYDPYTGHRDALVREAARLGLGERFAFTGMVPRGQLFHTALQHDAGIAFVPRSSEGTDPWTMIGASNKVFDYMACGLVPIVTNLSEWESFVVGPGYGVSCDPRDPDSIAATLDALAANPAARQRMADAGRARILKDWNYDTVFAGVLHSLTAHKQGNRPPDS